jgi:thiamine-monophosphate kinase
VNERARIAMLARVLSSGRCAGGVEVAMGDDAAVLDGGRGAGRKVVWTIDEQVDGTHFRGDLVSWRDVGWRSFMAAASDVAAMGAEPWCALSAVVVPDAVGDAALEELARGQREAADAVGAAIVGGNLSRGPALSVATTLLGTCERAVLRSGALPGDGVWLAGSVGLAAAGLRALSAGTARDGRLHAAVAAWRTPSALIREGCAMGAVAHAAIDVSDGLACDAGHLAEASGVRVVLDETELRSSAALRAAADALMLDALDLALYGGEDYALVVASPVPIEGFRQVGYVADGHGVSLRSAAGEQAIDTGGFDHFETRAR